MADGGLQLAGVQRPRQIEERLRLLAEELYVEHSLRSRQVVLGQVIVQTAARGSEVRDAGRGGHAGAGHGDDVLAAALLDVLHDAVKVDRLQHLRGDRQSSVVRRGRRTDADGTSLPHTAFRI